MEAEWKANGGLMGMMGMTGEFYCSYVFDGYGPYYGGRAAWLGGCLGCHEIPCRSQHLAWPSVNAFISFLSGFYIF